MRLNLLVLRCRDIVATRAFYEGMGIGLLFTQEQHGAGPDHYSAQLDGGLVLELYPAKGDTDNTRLGFGTGGGNCRVVEDPDGRNVELHGINGGKSP
jgi:catechol 2,3-dioxygenase-like lactoylglutathione lyase family enzyme